MLHLMQIEDRDLLELKTYVEKYYAICHGEELIPSKTKEGYWFVVKKTKEDYNVMLSTLGFASFTDVDFINGHAKINIMMSDWSDKDTILQVIKKLLKFGFNELRLQKIWSEVYENNPIKLIYEDVGFLAEGVRKKQKYINGRYIDTIVLSVLDKECLE